MLWQAILIAILAVGAFADEHAALDVHREQLKALLRAQCQKNGAEDKFNDVEQAGGNFVNCIKELINAETLKNEIEEAKPKGSLDEVFKKYCEKSPQLKACIHNLLDGITPCIDSSAREQIASGKNSTDQLIDFACYKDGDRIAMFIAEKGPECIQSKGNDLKECILKVKQSVPTVEAAKSLTLDERCAKYDELSKCFVSELEKCDTPTPANMVESLLNYIKKGSPCKKEN